MDGVDRPFLSFERRESGWSDDLYEFGDAESGANHFIARASRRATLEELRRRDMPAGATILEIGCSSGFLLRQVWDAFPDHQVIGADYESAPLEKLAAAQPTIPLLNFDLVDCPLPAECVDAVVLLNVLEHIPDDLAAAREVFRILKPGGMAVVEVPAGPHLFDAYDELFAHQRRYALPALCDQLSGIGFTIAKRTHLGFFIYPGFRWVKLRTRRYRSSARELQQKITARGIDRTGDNAVLKLMTGLELLLGRYVSFPIGIRCRVTLTKPA